ncbi:uncharacterized protein LOC131954345 [Physella acuta]|uniref:uncharacterized protein LOC131954345 n=1 Tax=Physella acuta TaxID=109671 RepID=UPI0027DACE73|nr:uncharacterized protein LOC131954345 [Physella acuta]
MTINCCSKQDCCTYFTLDISQILHLHSTEWSSDEIICIIDEMTSLCETQLQLDSSHDNVGLIISVIENPRDKLVLLNRILDTFKELVLDTPGFTDSDDASDNEFSFHVSALTEFGICKVNGPACL